MTPSALDLVLALTAAQIRAAVAVDETLEPWHGITLRELRLLRFVQETPGGTISLPALAASIGMAPSATLRLVQPLARTGLLRRDGRAIGLTPAGRQRLGEALSTAGRAAEQLLVGVPLERRTQLGAALGALTAMAAAPRADVAEPVA